MIDVAQGDDRLVEAVTLPAKILRKYHRGLVSIASRQDSEAFDDLVADGVMEVIRLHRRTPAGEGAFQFCVRACGHLIKYYRRAYHKAVGIYYSSGGEKRQTQKMNRIDFELVKDLITVRDYSTLLWIEVEDFLEGLQCDSDGGLSRWLSPSAGERGQRSSGSRRSSSDSPDSGAPSTSQESVTAA